MANLKLELPTLGAHRPAKSASREQPQADGARRRFDDALAADAEARPASPRANDAREARGPVRRDDVRETSRRSEAEDRTPLQRDERTDRTLPPRDLATAEGSTAETLPEASPEAAATAETGEAAEDERTALVEAVRQDEAVPTPDPIPATMPAPPSERAQALSQAMLGRSVVVQGGADAEGAAQVAAGGTGEATAARAQIVEADMQPLEVAAEGAVPALPFTALLDGASNPDAIRLPSEIGIAGKAEAPSHAPPATAAQPAALPVPLGAVPMTIALRSLQDTSRFEIRLDPVELGRIDVRLDIDKERGTVTADLVVDRPATLALLQRDAGALQQALSQTGLDAGGGISLSLRDGGGSQDKGDGQGGTKSGPGTSRQQADSQDVIDPSPWRVRLSGIDIRI